MIKRRIHYACIATAVVISLSTLSTAAPVLKDGSAAATPDSNKNKRADEIIGYGNNPTEKKSSEQLRNDVNTNEVIPSLGGVEPIKKDTSDASSVDGVNKSVAENGAQEVDQNDRDYETYDSVSNADQSRDPLPEDVSAEAEERSVAAEREDDDHYGAEDGEYDDSRRRRRSVQKTFREERSASNQPVAMVSENMVAPAVGVGARQQRAKRELDSEAIRELLETSRSQPESAVDYNDYGQTDNNEGGEYLLDQNPEEISVDGQEDLNNEESEEITPWSESDFTEDDRRPKRRLYDDDEDEEAYEEAEREVVRELLAERAAEETRQALLAFLSSNEHARNEIPAPERTYRLRDRRFDQDEDDEETAYADDDDDGEEEEEKEEEESVNEEEDTDDGQQVAVPEDIDESDERINDGPFLVEEEQDKPVEKKRFLYPYSYEPYGGRWGAMVPGAKREDRDPYDRLYRLAEALSRPTSIGDDEYKK